MEISFTARRDRGSSIALTKPRRQQNLNRVTVKTTKLTSHESSSNSWPFGKRRSSIRWLIYLARSQENFLHHLCMIVAAVCWFRLAPISWYVFLRDPVARCWSYGSFLTLLVSRIEVVSFDVHQKDRFLKKFLFVLRRVALVGSETLASVEGSCTCTCDAFWDIWHNLLTRVYIYRLHQWIVRAQIPE